MEFSKAKSWVLPLDHSNDLQRYRLGTEQLESCLMEEDLEVLLAAAEHEPECAHSV